MKTIVIFNSQTGFTRRYAEWIAEATGADFMELSLAKQKDLTAYEAVIFGGWACGGGIRNLSWFKKNMVNWQDKKLIVFCVGASPIENPEIEPALRHNFTDEEFKRVNVFYCPGGLNYGKMKAPSRLMMKMFLKICYAYFIHVAKFISKRFQYITWNTFYFKRWKSILERIQKVLKIFMNFIPVHKK